jgi:AcrR family transcriptional regulator
MGRPARIDRALVLDAALALADESGLAAVTMQGVAARLEVTPMALYRHVGDKDGLLDGLVERMLTEVEPPRPPLVGSDRLEAMARALRDVGLRHPSVFPLLLARPAATPEARRVRGSALRALEEAGTGPDRVAQTERLTSTAVLGFIVSEVSGRFRDHPRAVRDADFERLLVLLGAFVDPRPGDRPPVDSSD